MIQWSEELAIGIEELDAQHRALFAQVAALHERMRAGNVRGAEAALPALRAYVQEHFAAEEAYMARVRYPRLDQHREVHRAFAAQLARHEELFRQRGFTASLLLAMTQWLLLWLRNHVRGEDGELAGFVAARRRLGHAA